MFSPDTPEDLDLAKLKQAGLFVEQTSDTTEAVDFCTGKLNIHRLLAGDSHYWDATTHEQDYIPKIVVINNWQYFIATCKARYDSLYETDFEQDRTFFKMLLGLGFKIVVWTGFKEAFDNPINTIADLNKALGKFSAEKTKSIRAQLSEFKIPVDEVFIFDHQNKIKLFNQLKYGYEDPELLNFAATRLWQSPDLYRSIHAQAAFADIALQQGQHQYNHLKLDVFQLGILPHLHKEILASIVRVTLVGYAEVEQAASVIKFFPNLKHFTTAKNENYSAVQAYVHGSIPVALPVISAPKTSVEPEFKRDLVWHVRDSILPEEEFEKSRQYGGAELTGYGLENLPKFTHVNNLIIKRSNKCKAIFSTQLDLSHFQNLTNLTITDCKEIEILILPDNGKFKSLIIESVKILKPIIYPKSTKIQTLKLHNVHFANDLDIDCSHISGEAILRFTSARSINFGNNQKLKKLTIGGYHSLPIAGSLPQSLEALTLEKSIIAEDVTLDLSQLSNLKICKFKTEDPLQVIWPNDNRIEKIETSHFTPLAANHIFPHLKSFESDQFVISDSEELFFPFPALIDFVAFDNQDQQTSNIFNFSQLQQIHSFQLVISNFIDSKVILPKQANNLSSFSLSDPRGSTYENLDLTAYPKLSRLELDYDASGISHIRTNPQQITHLRLETSGNFATLDLSNFTELTELGLVGHPMFNLIMWPTPNNIRRLDVSFKNPSPSRTSPTDSLTFLCSFLKLQKLSMRTFHKLLVLDLPKLNMLEYLEIHNTGDFAVRFDCDLPYLNKLQIEATNYIVRIGKSDETTNNMLPNLRDLELSSKSYTSSINFNMLDLNSVYITAQHTYINSVRKFKNITPPSVDRTVHRHIEKFDHKNKPAISMSTKDVGDNKTKIDPLTTESVYEIAVNGRARGFHPNYYRINCFNASKIENDRLISYPTDVSANYIPYKTPKLELQSENLIRDNIVTMHAPMLVSKQFSFLPSLLIYEELLFLENYQNYDLIYSPDRNQYAIKLKSDHPYDLQKTTVRYQIKVLKKAFLPMHQARTLPSPSLPAEIFTALDKIKDQALFARFLQPGDDEIRIQAMVEFFNKHFISEGEQAEIQPDPHSPTWLLPLLQQKGVCRHRARMAALICQYNRWPSRQFSNEIHQFIEIYHDNKWVMYCLGGGRINDLTITKTHDAPELSTQELQEMGRHKQESSHDHIAQPATKVTELINTNETAIATPAWTDELSEPFMSTQDFQSTIVTRPSIPTKILTNRFEKLFLTPQARYNRITTISQLYQEIQADQRLLIRLPDAAFAHQLNANLLEHFFKHASQGDENYVYVRSAKEMRSLLTSARISAGELSTVPGVLKQLLSSRGMLVINWDNFTPNEMAIYKSLFDETATLNAIPVNQQLKIVNFESEPRASEAFYSRFKNNIVTLPETFYHQLTSPNLSSLPAQGTAGISVNLYQDNSTWKSILLGNISANQDYFDFQPGAIGRMLAAQQTCLHLIDAPLANEEFQEFMHQLYHSKKVTMNGEVVKLPDNFEVIFEKSKDYQPTLALQSQRLASSFEINTSTFSLLFPHTVINESGFAVPHPGYLTLFTQFHLASNLSANHFKRLVESLAEHQSLSVDASVTIDGIQTGVPPASTYQPIPLPIPNQSMVILSTDIDCTAYDYQQQCRVPESHVFPISLETEFGDLFESYRLSDQCGLLSQLDDGKSVTHLRFSKTVASCWQKILNGETVVLKGRISARLFKQISSIFNPGHQLVANGQVYQVDPAAGLGKMILITELNPQQKLTYPANTAYDQLTQEQVISGLKFYKSYQREIFNLIESVYSLAANPQFNLKLPCNWNILTTLLERLSQQSFPLAREKIIKTLLFVNLNLSPSTRKHLNYKLRKICSAAFASTVEVKSSGKSSQLKAAQRIVDLFNHGQTKIVVLQGNAGQGKTHIASLLKSDPKLNAELFWGEPALEKCLNTITSKKKILFLDEFNLRRDDHWNMFAQIDQGIIQIKGKQYFVPADQPIFIVCTCNPPGEYVGRFLQSTLSHRAVTLNVRDHSHQELVDLTQQFCADLALIKNPPPEIYQKIIKAYHLIKTFFKDTIDFSLRDIQMMCMRLEVIKRKHVIPGASDETYALLSIMHEFAGLFNSPASLEEFRSRLLENCTTTSSALAQAEAFIREKPLHIANYTLQPSRIPTLITLMEDLQMAELSQSEPGFAKYRRGILLEGPSGVGKSKLGMALFDSLGYQNLNAVAEAYRNEIDKGYYVITVGSGDEEKLLLDAFCHGHWVILDELNLNPKIEILLNQLLTGVDMEGKPSQRPGFMVFASQNPLNFEGTKVIAKALLNRFHTVQIQDYPVEELQQIATESLAAKQLGFAQHATQFVQAYQNAVKDQKENIINTRTFFDVINSVELEVMLRQRDAAPTPSL